MLTNGNTVVVAGHVCVDIIPGLDEHHAGAAFTPGTLTLAGPAAIATGGAVSNTGVAMHRLGNSTILMGKTGNDILGDATRSVIESRAPGLTEGMIVAHGEPSSYTLVISPPDIDRSFLHFPGPNATFQANDVDYDAVSEARLFHFGYPTLMKRMYENEGSELAAMFERVKSTGVITSLDITLIDPDSESGRLDWMTILERTLPHVDVFLPGLEEILFMLDRPCFERFMKKAGAALFSQFIDEDFLNNLASRLIDMGVKIAGLKMGEDGLFIKTAGNTSALGLDRRWDNCQLFTQAYDVDVVGTTGAGDCAIAGFISGLVRGQSPKDTLATAAASGATACEALDATAGVPDWDTLQARIAQGWQQRKTAVNI